MNRLLFLISICLLTSQVLSGQSFTIEQASQFPFPSELTASAKGEKIAWAMNEKGLRNIYVAEGPGFSHKKITAFEKDDGQEISSLQYSYDGNWLVFVRGGDHGGDRANEPVNVTHSSEMPTVAIWKVPVGGGNALKLAEGDEPVVSPNSDKIAFIKNGQVWTLKLDEYEAKQLFQIKGNAQSLSWSPDGKQLLFVANRATHSLIGVFTDNENPIQWIEPSFHRDQSPKWSPEGDRVVFVRTQGGSGAALPILEQRHNPWEIWVGDPKTGQASKRWKAPETLRGSVPTTHGGFNLNWAADNQLVYLSYEDGWPHLYAMDAMEGPSRQLTSGDYMVEHIRLTPDKKALVFSVNTGNSPQDIDRRHIGMVPVIDGEMKLLTMGEGIEAIPIMLDGGKYVSYLSATTQRPLLPAVLSVEEGDFKLLAEELIPEDFPLEDLVRPSQVIFKAADGLTVHGQLFEKEGGPDKKPAVLFVHGGPQRQMLLGWSYMDYYSNAYAINQKLAEMGFVVLSVNFRLGIGYGYGFHRPAKTYWQGAEEYLDIKAAGVYLAGLPQVDAERIGIYGGSYGGFLTALALGRDSDLFKVGVDIHGVHDFEGRAGTPDGFESAPDHEAAVRTAWESSPFAYLESWTSPVLFIHSDDDRNVNFSQTTDLIRRFEERKIPYESLMIPGDTHHWMKYSNMVRVNKATVDFLGRYLKP